MKGALRLIFPPQCLGCGQPVGSDGGLCPDCWSDTEFISASACQTCGVPLPGQDATADAGLACDDCVQMSRPWDAARAAVVYAGTGRALVLMLKHGDRLDLLPALGDWLAVAAHPLVGPDSVVVPIPMHPSRLIKRKYNQAALLGRHVARAHGLGWMPDLLYRIRSAPMQGQASLQDRFMNQRDAIGVRADRTHRLAGRPVLLVDDVMASGATMAAAAGALAAAGVARISVSVLARAVKDH